MSVPYGSLLSWQQRRRILFYNDIFEMKPGGGYSNTKADKIRARMARAA
jgi:hypothetical protein